jgi:tetratricopeptide (TPR) repeat protein
MAVNSKYDFVGGYEHDTQAGMLHVSDHHYSPGKKQWTWGNGDFGQAWDRNLTDEDGPYIEIMCGVYTDNQPDFTWIQAHEEKIFTQYFLPFHTLGGVKNASKDLLLNVESHDVGITIKVYATSKHDNLLVKLFVKEKLEFQKGFNLLPSKAFEQIVPFGKVAEEDLHVEISNKNGDLLLAYQGETIIEKAIPDPAKAPDFPSDVKHIEDLYYIGQHLEQYRHATYDPLDYYNEALKRDESDLRCNNAVGLINLRKGKLEEAEQYFLKAIEKVTKRNPNPTTGEYHFNLGLTQFFQERKDDAFEMFSKACWCLDRQDRGNFYLSAIMTSKGKYSQALEKIEKSLIVNSRSQKARHLKVHLLYKLGRQEEAKSYAEESLALDQFNFSILWETYFESPSSRNLDYILELMRHDFHNFMECAKDFAEIGDHLSAIKILSLLAEEGEGNPLLYYTIGVYKRRLGLQEEAIQNWEKAESMPLDFCFLNRLYEFLILEEVIEAQPSAANAKYLRGNYLYSKKEHDLAAASWEDSIVSVATNPIAHRNLALFYYNKADQRQLAKEHLEIAFSIDSENARLLMELDQFYKKTNMGAEFRFDFLSKKWDLVIQRDDLYLEYVTLLNILGRHQQALEVIEKRIFQPWEGGEGKVPSQYLTAKIELAKHLIWEEKHQEAISHLMEARSYPQNLGEGKLYGARENDVFYWLGTAAYGAGEIVKAGKYWKKGAEGDTSVGQAFFYNDQQPDKVFYQALCLAKIGKEDEAKPIFEKIITYGQNHSDDKIVLDYFAISLPDLLIWEEDLSLRNRINCYYLTGLGQMGLGFYDEAQSFFEMALQEDSYHLGAVIHLQLVLQHQKQITDGII